MNEPVERSSPASETLDTVLAMLRQRQVELNRMGIVHAHVFGSVARRKDNLQSDVDIAVEIDYSRGFSTFNLMRLEEDFAELLHRRVDLVSVGGLDPSRHAVIFRDMVVAF